MSDKWYARAPAFSANLIGRSGEWRTLEQCWRAVTGVRGESSCWRARPGWGNPGWPTTSVRHAVAQGAIALRGRGYDATAAIPFAPVVEALRGALAAPGLAGAAPEWLAEAARLLPELRQRFTQLPPAETPAGPQEAWRVFEGAAQVLSSVAAEQPIVVTIDDLHWCDEDSANLLRFLIRRLEQAPVLWLATVTLGEMERDAPAARLTRVLRAKSHATSISLSCLNEEEVWQLIRELGHLSAPTARPPLRSPGVQHHRRQPVLHPGAAQDHVRPGTAGDRRADPRVDAPRPARWKTGPCSPCPGRCRR